MGLEQPPRRPVGQLPLVQLLPNLITVGALCAGLTALRSALDGDFRFAVALIILAAILDGLDGRLARLLRSESRIGAELDTLCDFVNFGVIPGFVLYLWALEDLPRVGWIATLVYIACCLLRLARFNITHKAPDPGVPVDQGFEGVPSPAGAMLVLAPMFLSFLLGLNDPLPTGLVALWMVFTGALMIGRFRTPSLKSISIARDYASYAVIGFVAVLALLTAYPWATLFALDAAYLAGLAWLVPRGMRAVRRPAEGPLPKDE